MMTNSFRKANLFFIVVFFLALFTSCEGPITIRGIPLRLLANFDSDAVGALPNLALPGDPAGDQILRLGRAEYFGIVEGENKRLRIENRSYGSSRGDRMAFRGTSTTYPTTVYYSWNQQIENPFTNGKFEIHLTDGAGNDNVSLVFADYRREPGGTSDFGYLYLMPSREFLGKVPAHQNCFYDVTINPITNTFSLVVTRPGFGDGNLSITNHTLSISISNGTKNPSIEIRCNTDPPEFQNGSLANPASGWLYLDNLKIQAD